MQTHHYTKIYTVMINRIAIENYRWYYGQKGNVFKCAMVVKETNDNRLSPCFLVFDESDSGEIILPKAYKTIRPLECVVLHEEIVDGLAIYNFIANYNASEIIQLKKAG